MNSLQATEGSRRPSIRRPLAIAASGLAAGGAAILLAVLARESLKRVFLALAGLVVEGVRDNLPVFAGMCGVGVVVLWISIVICCLRERRAAG